MAIKVGIDGRAPRRDEHHALLACFNGMNIQKTKDHLQRTSHTGFVAVEFYITICETTFRVKAGETMAS